MHDEDRLKEELAKPGTPDMVRRHAAELMRIKAKSDAGGELTGEERFFVEVTNEFTWALENLEPEHE